MESSDNGFTRDDVAIYLTESIVSLHNKTEIKGTFYSIII
jgi:hypothetical protein